MILLIDNYDSFSHNLARYFVRLGHRTEVVRNTAVDVAAVRRLKPDALVLSPGPCAPRQAGCSLELVRSLHREFPILGICLGHQVIAEAFGGRVVPAIEPIHGRATAVCHDGLGIFQGLPEPFMGGRYHSLTVEEPSLPGCLEISARAPDGTVMALQHWTLPIVGLQFHPESILTEYGYRLLANYLKLAGLPVAGLVPSIDTEYVSGL